MIKPTVGRVVWYVACEGDQHGSDPLPKSDQVCAALIAYVHSDTMVNLAVIDCNGKTHSRRSVALVHEGAKEGPYCTWMPFQKGQAAKTEALEKQVATNV